MLRPIILRLGTLAATTAVLLGLGVGTASAGSPNLKPGSVPAPYVNSVKAAAGTCTYVNAPLLAAQIEQESNWNPRAVSSAGAQGIAQFKPATWAVYGRDFDRDGDGSPFDPEDAITAQGIFMCDLIDRLGRTQLSGDLWTLTLWSYNAGLQATIDAGGRAPTAEAANYANRILNVLMVKYLP